MNWLLCRFQQLMSCRDENEPLRYLGHCYQIRHQRLVIGQGKHFHRYHKSEVAGSSLRCIPFIEQAWTL